MNRRSSFVALSLGLGLGTTGCQERLYQVEVEVRASSSLGDVFGSDDIDLGFAYLATVNGAIVNDGTFATSAEALPFPAEATALAMTVEARDDAFALLGAGRSATLTLPEPSDTPLVFSVLLAPANVIDAVSATPPDIGDGACSAVEGDGTIYLVGGRTTGNSAYIYDTVALEAVKFNAENQALVGVVGPGCAAGFGKVAALGGCNAGAIDSVVVFDREGNDTLISVAGVVGELCGAAAAPRPDDQVWVITADNTVSLARVGTQRTVSASLGTERQGLEVTDDGALVILVDGVATYFDKDGGERPLGPARAMGRHGDDVVLLVGTSVELVRGGATVNLRNNVDVALASLVVLSDKQVVGITGAGDVVRVAGDGTVTDVPSRTGTHFRVSALAGDTVLLAPTSGVGLDGVAFTDD